MQSSLTLITALVGSALAGCAPTREESTVRLTFPRAHSQSISALFNPTDYCFAANITGADIAPLPQSPCDPPIGVMGGSVGEGEMVALQAPKGTNRTIEIYAIEKASAGGSCPAVTKGFATLERSKVHILATQTLDLLQSDVTVAITVAPPTTTNALMNTLSLPASCVFAPTPLPGAPSAPTITSPSSNPYTSAETSFALSGGCETGATVSLSGSSAQTTTCSSSAYSFTISKTADGTYSFNVSQTDAESNTSGSTSFSWTRDTLVTPVSITSPAASPAATSTNSFTIAGSCRTGATVYLSGDSSQSGTCTASAFSFVVTKTTDSFYSFVIRQALSSVFSAPVQVGWKRDTRPPPPPTIDAPPGPIYSSDNSFLIHGTCETNATVSLSGDVSGTQPCTGGMYSFLPIKNIDGVYNFSVQQTDSAGNVAGASSIQWIRNSALPFTPILTSPSSPIVTTAGGSITIAGSCINGSNVILSGDVVSSDVLSPTGVLMQTCAGGVFSFGVGKSANGIYKFKITQDNAGNVSGPALVSWRRDTAPPAAPTVTSPHTSSFVSSGDLRIAGTCESGTYIGLSGSDTNSTTCEKEWYSLSVPKSVDGSYSYNVAQTDNAGNVSGSVSLSWVRNSSKPATPVILTPIPEKHASTVNSQVFAGVCTSGATVTLFGSVSDSEVTGNSRIQTCTNDFFSFTVTKSSDGLFDLNVSQTVTGITSGAASTRWILDSTPPVTTISQTPEPTNYNLDAVFTFTSNEPGSVFECSLDGAGYSPCPTPMKYPNLSNASHTLDVRAIDRFGHVDPTPASYTWTQYAHATVALYHFDGNATDDSAYTNTTTPSFVTWLTAKFSTNGASFNSTSPSSISASHSPALAVLKDRMTADAWVQFTSLPSTGTKMVIASKMGTSGQLGWEFGIKTTGPQKYLYFLGSLDGSTTTETMSTALNTGEASNLTTAMNHVAITWNRGIVKFYLNGVSKGDDTIGTAGSASLFNNTSTPLRIGRTEAVGSYLNGKVDEFRLSQTIRWNSGFTVPTGAYTAD